MNTEPREPQTAASPAPAPAAAPEWHEGINYGADGHYYATARGTAHGEALLHRAGAWTDGRTLVALGRVAATSRKALVVDVGGGELLELAPVFV